MTDSTTFSSRSNAKRGAEKAIRAGNAPSIDYGIKPCDSDRYRFEIVWHRKGGTEVVPTTEQVAGEVEAHPLTLAEFTQTPEAQANKATWDDMLSKAEAEGWPDSDPEALDDAEEESVPDEGEDAPAEEPTSDGEQSMADRFPPGTRVTVQVSARKRRTGVVDYRVDYTMCRVKFDGPNPSELCRYSQLMLDDGSEPIPVPAKAARKPRAAPSGDRKPSKNAELDAAAARGEMPTKPIITSKANKEQYQKRFDQLEKSALAGDWDAVLNFHVKGINSYAKMVKQYRARLLAAHEAQQ